MAWIRESEVRGRARDEARVRGRPTAALLAHRVERQHREPMSDIYLSHGFEDRELVLGLTLLIEDLGYRVFVDGRDDWDPKRQPVGPDAAGRLRARLSSSSGLIYATMRREAASHWTPWELGFKDGKDGRAAILPVLPDDAAAFDGEGYLGLYPYVQGSHGTQGSGRGASDLRVCQSSQRYVTLRGWLSGQDPYFRSGIA